MKKSIIWIFLIAIFLIVITGCEMLERQSSISLNHYRIGEYSEKSGHPVLIFMENEESDKRVSLNMDGQKKLAKALYRYSGMIAVNATCSPEGRLLDYTVQEKTPYGNAELGQCSGKSVFQYTLYIRQNNALHAETDDRIFSKKISGLDNKEEDVSKGSGKAET